MENTRKKSRKKSRSKSRSKSKPQPANPKLYETVKSEAKRKFNVYPSAYANGWVVQEYKRRGGKYKGKKPDKSHGIGRWFDENWIDVCKLPKKVPCGRPKTTLTGWMNNYPYCRPSKRVNSSTPKTVYELSKDEITRRCNIKRASPMRRVMPKSRLKSVRKTRRSSPRKSRKSSHVKQNNNGSLKRSIPHITPYEINLLLMNV